MFHRARSEHSAWDLSYIYFFLIAVAYKVPWTAISSLLGQFSAQFQQPRILLWLNLAYFVPSMPVLLLQSSLQDRLEQRLGVPRATMARFVFGLSGLAGLCLAMPYCCTTPRLLLAGTAAVGVCYSIAFGTSYQLVTHFTPGCTVALTTGFVSCGLVVLLADLALKGRGPYYTAAGMVRLFQVVACQTLIGLAAAAAILRRHWRRLAAAGPAAAAGSIALGLKGAAGVSSNGRPIIGLPLSTLGGLKPGVPGGLGLRHRVEPPAYDNSNSQQLQQQQQQRHKSTSGDAGSEAPAVAINLGADHHCSNDAGATLDAPHPPPSTSRNSSKGGGSGGSSSSSTRAGRSGPQLLLKVLSKLLRGLAACSAPLVRLLQLGGAIWPAWLGLLLSVGSSMLAFPFFTFVPHHGAFGQQLPQVLFYARLLGDIMGRLVPPRLHLDSSTSVLTAAACKVALLLLLLPAMLQPSRVGGDLPLAVLVAVNWWLSGYTNTGAYLLAPKLAAEAAAAGRLRAGVHGDSSKHGSASAAGVKARAGGLMAFCFQVSCFLGLVAAWALQTLVLADWSHPGFSGQVSSGGGPSAAAAAAVAADSLTAAQMKAAVMQRASDRLIPGQGVLAAEAAAAAAAAAADGMAAVPASVAQTVLAAGAVSAT